MKAAAASWTAAIAEENTLKVLVQELENELNPNFFLNDNTNSSKQEQQQQQRFIAKWEIKLQCSPSSKKTYSPMRVKSRNFLTNIS